MFDYQTNRKKTNRLGLSEFDFLGGIGFDCFFGFGLRWVYTKKPLTSGGYNRASDRLRQKKGNFAAFSREIMRQKRSIMRQIMRFF